MELTDDYHNVQIKMEYDDVNYQIKQEFDDSTYTVIRQFPVKSAINNCIIENFPRPIKAEPEDFEENSSLPEINHFKKFETDNSEELIKIKQEFDLVSTVKIEENEVSFLQKRSDSSLKLNQTVEEETIVGNHVVLEPSVKEGKITEQQVKRKKPASPVLIELSSESDLSNNEEGENGDKVHFKGSCLNCDKEFSSYGKWFRHMEAFKDLKGCFPVDTSSRIKPEVYVIASPDNTPKTNKKDVKGITAFKCPRCDFKTFYKQDVSIHFEAKHTIKIFKCAMCPKLFKTVKYLKKHLAYVHSQNHFLFQCKSCDYSTKDKYSLKIHQLVHSNVYHRCDLCEFSTKNRAKLKVHHRRRHSNTEKLFKCELCNYSGKEKKYLDRHTILKHNSEGKQVSCEICSFQTKNTKYLLSHIRNMHSEKDDPYYYCYCGYQANRKTDLMTHKLIKHSSKKPLFNCEDCPFSTTKKDIFFVHLNLKHRGRLPLDCNECSYLAPNLTDFRMHVYKKHSPFHAWAYCAYCDYKALGKHVVANHILFKHSPKVKKLKCDKCKYSARTKYLLRLHTNTRHNPNAIVYHCIYCDHSTKIKFKLAQHMKLKHNFRNKKIRRPLSAS